MAGPGENKDTDKKKKKIKNVSCGEGADKLDGHPADKIVKEARALRVGNDHYREERNQRGKYQAVNKDNEGRFLQVGKLRMLDLTIDLRQGLFAAHGENGVAEGNENPEQSEGVGKLAAAQPSQ